MTFYVYGLKNRLVGQFEKPFSEAIEPKEYIDQLTLSMSVADPAILNRYKEYDLYCLGSVDNKTGEVITSCSFIASLEPICLSILDHKANENGRKQEA